MAPGDNVVVIPPTVEVMDRIRARLEYRETTASVSSSEHTKSHMASDREYVDLKLDLAEARAEARFIELNGKLDRVADSLAAITSQMSENRAEIRAVRDDAHAENKTTRTTVLVTALASVLALGALLISMMTYGDAIFSRGMSVRDVVNSVAKEQSERTSGAKQSP